MGMGYGAGYADTVSEEFVREIAGVEFDAFVGALNAADVEMSYFAAGLYGDGNEGEAVLSTFEALSTTFESVTGLTLDVGFHDSQNNGDRYDDIDGVYWSVGNVYMRTAAGEKYEDKITRSNFLTFG